MYNLIYTRKYLKMTLFKKVYINLTILYVKIFLTKMALKIY